MLRISKESWDEVVDWYFGIPQKYKKFSLQLYPFYRKENQSILKSNDFFENVIKNGYFVQDSQIIEVGINFMQRKDGSFRNTQLLSPILFLLLETIGLDIYKCYSVRFEHPVEVYYAGNYEEKSVYYRNSYQNFYKKTQELSQDFDKYIKFDIKNFFTSINLNVLFNQIAEGNVKFTEVDYFIMREFLLFLGEGKYPVVENSAALSYLSTKIYLEKSDSLLSKYLDKQKWIRNWRGIRFVDDLYLFYNSKNNDDSSHLWELIKIYDDILFEFDLQLNMEKISYDSTLSIAQVVKQTSFANDYYERVGVDFPRGKFTNFLENYI